MFKHRLLKTWSGLPAQTSYKKEPTGRKHARATTLQALRHKRIGNIKKVPTTISYI